MKSIEGMSLVGGKPVEWERDGQRGYWGYSVHIDNGVWPEHVGFPAFTHEQMEQCARIEEEHGEKWGFDSYPHLVFNADGTWSEVYGGGDEKQVADVLLPFCVDGVELYAIGQDWPWGEVDDDYEYEVA